MVLSAIGLTTEKWVGSGYSYIMGIADEAGEQDLVFKSEGTYKSDIVPKDSIRII